MASNRRGIAGTGGGAGIYPDMILGVNPPKLDPKKFFSAKITFSSLFTIYLPSPPSHKETKSDTEECR